MPTIVPPPASHTTSNRDAFTTVRHYLSGRRGLIAAGTAIAFAGLADLP